MNIKTLFTTYNGRISRSQYWIGFVMLLVLSIVVGFILGLMGIGGGENPNLIEVIFGIGMLVLAFALYIKRFHDMDKNGWFSLLMLIPLVNLAVGLIWLGFMKGTDGDNQYGPDPLAGSNAINAE